MDGFCFLCSFKPPTPPPPPPKCFHSCKNYCRNQPWGGSSCFLTLQSDQFVLLRFASLHTWPHDERSGNGPLSFKSHKVAVCFGEMMSFCETAHSAVLAGKFFSAFFKNLTTEGSEKHINVFSDTIRGLLWSNHRKKVIVFHQSRHSTARWQKNKNTSVESAHISKWNVLPSVMKQVFVRYCEFTYHQGI